MGYVFTSHTTIEFQDKDILEAFVKSLPLNSIQKKNIMEGEEIADRLDESGFPGAENMVHKFKITETK